MENDSHRLSGLYSVIVFIAAAIIATIRAAIYFGNGKVLWDNSLLIVDIAGVLGLFAIVGFVFIAIIGTFNPENKSKSVKAAVIAGTICVAALFALMFTGNFLPDVGDSIKEHANAILTADNIPFSIAFGVGWGITMTWVARTLYARRDKGGKPKGAEAK